MLGLARGLAAALVVLLSTASAEDKIAPLGFEVRSKVMTQCGNTQIQWQNGNPPLYITVIPEYHVATNISIPEDTQNTTGGKFNFALPYPSGVNVTFILSDADGFASGGVSKIYHVGELLEGDRCDIVGPWPSFSFDMSPSTEFINECENINFLWDPEQSHDGTFVTGVIPSGEVIQWYTSPDKRRTGWTLNMAEGTQVIWAVWDGQGNQGGTSKVFTVGGGNNDCINLPYSSTPAWTPTSVGQRPTETGQHRGGVVTVTAIPAPRPKSAADLSGGAIAGIVVAVVVVVLILQAILLWFCCRRQLSTFLDNRRQQRERRRNPDVDLFETNGTNMTSLSSRTGRHSQAAGPGATNPFDDQTATVSPFVGGSECPSPISPISPGGLNSSSGLLHSSSGLHSPGGLSPVGPFSPVNPTNHSYFLTTQGSNSGSADSERSIGASAGASIRAPSKAQLAATNPDDGMLSPLYADLPPPSAPRGGFRRHQDAGRVNVPEPEVEDLPPNYNPEWERDR